MDINNCYGAYINMKKPIIFCEIENYEDAYIDRYSDFKILKNSDRKVITMHFGGVVLECFLKNKIIKEKKIIKSHPLNENRWYNKEIFNKLQLDINNSPGDVNNKIFKCGLENPSHNLGIFAHPPEKG
jgi:hypothetical protein